MRISLPESNRWTRSIIGLTDCGGFDEETHLVFDALKDLGDSPAWLVVAWLRAHCVFINEDEAQKYVMRALLTMPDAVRVLR
jgi:hypothetical protein